MSWACTWLLPEIHKQPPPFHRRAVYGMEVVNLKYNIGYTHLLFQIYLDVNVSKKNPALLQVFCIL